jgi:hypothetical protein
MSESMHAAKLKNAQATADRNLFMNRVLGAQYLRADDVTAVVAEMLYTVKSRFLELPNKLAPLVTGKEVKEVAKIIRAGCIEAIKDLQQVDSESIEVRNRKMLKYKQKIDENQKTYVSNRNSTDGIHRIKV